MADYKLQWAGVLIGVFVFAWRGSPSWLSPVYALRLATAKGDRDALRLLSAHDGAARKLSAHHVPQPEQHGTAGHRKIATAGPT